MTHIEGVRDIGEGGTQVLTAGIDVSAGRIEIEAVGWPEGSLADFAAFAVPYFASLRPIIFPTARSIRAARRARGRACAARRLRGRSGTVVIVDEIDRYPMPDASATTSDLHRPFARPTDPSPEAWPA